jgi:DNA topoisomerase-2
MLGRNPEDDPPRDVLKRPGMYIGSITPVPSRWTFDTDTKGMVKRDISYVPGRSSIFDEIPVNAT